MTVRCPSCASELPEGMRFCGNCGHRLAVGCSQCGAPAELPGQRFCGGCGAPLAAGGGGMPTRERRLVSVLFCDLVGFTPFTEARDPEDVRDVLEHYFAATREILSRYGGTIEKYIGDAVMAVWGAPVAREDDAERAVRAALGITDAVARVAQELQIPELRVRVGVLTGEAAVDRSESGNGMLVGDAVNTASRIQSVAPPGTVFVDDTTRLACQDAVVFEDGGHQELKGKSAPVHVWRAVRVRGADAQPPDADAVLSPLVAREEQLRAVRGALDALLAEGAQMRLVSVIADAGLGKSRLAREFERYADAIDAPLSWYRGRALSFGDGGGLSALAEIVATRAGIVHEDPRERRLILVDDLLAEDFPAGDPLRERVRRAVVRLLDLDDGRAAIEQGELFSAWRLLFERLAARRPVALVFEELHAADQALLDFVSHLLEWAHASPILGVAVGRPDPRVEALAAAGMRVELPPLSDMQMDELVRATVVDAPPALLQAVRTDGGGVPLYAVETLRALADHGVLERQHGRYVVRGELAEVKVPPTIHALIASRLDRLGDLERRLLIAGAVLGERFTAAGAAMLAALAEADATALLDGLVDKALLARDDGPRAPTHSRYGFLQGVVRRVTLGTLSRRDLKRLHLAAADQLPSDGSELDRAAALAGHLLAAEQADPAAADAESIRGRARAALREAAERAGAVGALEQALSLFDGAARLGGAEHQRAALLEAAGAVAHRAGDDATAAQRYRAAGDLHATAGRERERLRARTNELAVLCYVRDPNDQLADLRAVDAALAGVADAASAQAGAVLAYTLYQCGEHAEAIAVAARAVEAAQASGAMGELVEALNAQASALDGLARVPEAVEVGQRAIALARTHDPRRVAPLAGNLAVFLGALGRYAESAALAREAIAAAERMAQRFVERWSRLVLGRALCSLGEWDEAIAEIEPARPHAHPYHGMAVAPLVAIAVARGEEERAQELLVDHDRRAAEPGGNVFESDFRLLRAALLTPPGDVAALAAIVARAEVADLAEWSGWLPVVVDRLVWSIDGREGAEAADAAEHLRAALTALCGPGAMRQTAPVRAQAMRLEAHLSAAGGDTARAAELLARARSLAEGCGLAFEAAVLALELAQHGRCDSSGLTVVTDTFRRLGAVPWLARAQRALAHQGA